MHPVFYVSILYFLLGAAGIARLSSRRKAGTASPWPKFLVYFVLVHAVLLLILAGGLHFFCFAILLCLTGGYELCRVFPFKQKPLSAFLSFFIGYASIAAFFLCFSFEASVNLKVFTYLMVFCFDGFSQLTGQLFGKTTFTRISPGKTLEGLAGGLLLTLLTALVFPVSPSEDVSRVLLSLALIAAAFFGDLMASAYKRYCGVKDFSRLLPGHGGVMDRFDSLFLAGGLAYLILHLLGPA